MRCSLILVGVFVFGSAAEAGLVTRILSADYRVPDEATHYSDATFTPGTFTVGAGIETTGLVEGVTTLPVDFTDDSLTITLNTTLSNPTWGSAPFNGIDFDLSSPGTLGITGATIDPSTTLAGFDAGRVTFSDSRIGINWNGLTYHDGEKVAVNFTFSSVAAVPEPSTLISGGIAALFGLGYGWRRRKAMLAA